MLKKAFPILALCMFSSILGMGIINPLLPIYVTNMGATGTQLGLIFAAYGISNAFAGPFIGRLSDRKGRRFFLCSGLLIYSVISLAYVWADNVTLLILVRIGQGVAMSMTMPIAQAYIGDISPEGEEGKWMGYSQAAFFSGFGFGPLMGGLLNDHFGMNAAFYAMGSFNLAAFLLAFFFLPETERKQRMAKPNLSFREMGASNMIKALFSFRLVDGIGRGAAITFLPLFASINAGLNTTLIGILLSANILLASGLSLFGGKIADKYNRRFLIIIGSSIFLLYAVLIPSMHSFWPLLFLSGFQAVGNAISMPAASALAIEEGRRFGMGSTIAIFMLAMSIGMGIGPIVSGVIVDMIDIDSAFYFAAIVGFIGTALFYRFSNSYRMKVTA